MKNSPANSGKRAGVRSSRHESPTRGVVETQADMEADASIGAEAVRQMVADAAYYHALSRGFTWGREQEDWFMAEREISQMLASRSAVPAAVGLSKH